MDELDALTMELLAELEQLPEECPELRQLWLRTLELARWEQRIFSGNSPTQPTIH